MRIQQMISLIDGRTPLLKSQRRVAPKLALSVDFGRPLGYLLSGAKTDMDFAAGHVANDPSEHGRLRNASRRGSPLPNVRFRGQSGHRADVLQCPLMT
jgi:hypothetical protein